MNFMLILGFTITEGVLVGVICSKYTLAFPTNFMMPFGFTITEGVLMSEFVLVSLYMGTPAVRSSWALSSAAVGPANVRGHLGRGGMLSRAAVGPANVRGHLGHGGTDIGESKEMTGSQFQVVYNAFAIQWVDMIVSGLVTFIAAYHYERIFKSWVDAYDYSTGSTKLIGVPFKDAYRYMEWLLTVPLLLVEILLVMKLNDEEFNSKSWSLGLAAALLDLLVCVNDFLLLHCL